MSGVNKLEIALQVREAMRGARKGKPVAFSWPVRPSALERSPAPQKQQQR